MVDSEPLGHGQVLVLGAKVDVVEPNIVLLVGGAAEAAPALARVGRSFDGG